MSSIVRLIRSDSLATAPCAYAATARGLDDQLLHVEAIAALPGDLR